MKVNMQDEMMEFTRQLDNWIDVFENRVSSLLSDVHALELARFFKEMSILHAEVHCLAESQVMIISLVIPSFIQPMHLCRPM